MESKNASATGKHETKARPGGLKRAEKERSHLLYFALVLLLILGIAVVVYAFSLETLGSLFNNDYFNNVVRFSFALLLVATVVYLITKEKKYTYGLDTVVEELETNMEDLKGSLKDVSMRLEISRMVAISEDLHEKLESKFPGMKNHWKRTSFYAVETARKMELDEDYIHLIEKAGELMDIGMLRFGDTFRTDTADLNPWEKEMVRRHPSYSVEILASIRPDWEILPLVRHHHEWWNGMGYPDGLKGESIPLGSRILQLTDAFVAMTSYRAYRGAREAVESLAEIEVNGGVQFDPRVVKAFVAFMAPRVFLDADGMPSERGDAEIPAAPLAGIRPVKVLPVNPDGNGKGSMGVLEVEDLLRDISG